VGQLPHSGWDASSLLFKQLNAAPVGAVVVVAVIALGLVGLHHSAQAALIALGPARVVLLARSLTADVLWVAVVVVAVVVVALTILGSRIGWRLRIDWRSTSAK
jgi:hypothetical protein